MKKVCTLVVALAAMSAVWFSATDAQAFHRHRWGCGGCWGGSYGCAGASWGCSGGCWGCGGGCWGCGGGYYGVPARWYGHGYGCCGWGGASYGGWGCSGGCYGCYGCSGGYAYSCAGCSGCCGGVIYSEGPSVPVDATPATPTEPTPAAADQGKSAYLGSGLLLVKVPADAKVLVNGKQTTSMGTERQYVSRGLLRGSNYNFVVTATTMRDGKPVTMTKTATLGAGGNAVLSFDDMTDSATETVVAKPVTTKLTVRVPADAKVYLAGNETQQTGEMREFSTTKLGAGEGWNGYTVRAEVEKDGKLLTQEQVVSIGAGESKEIAFDFADVASDKPIAETAKK